MAYANVTISGLPGGGSTTLGKTLVKKLGWEYFSGGDFLRAYAIEHNLFDEKNKLHHDQSIMSDDVDRNVDFMMRKWAQTKQGMILDSWLSGFMTQGIEGTLHVLVYCSDDSVRIDRIVNRDGVSIEEAKKHIFERERRNREKWERMYAKEWHEWVVGVGKASADEPIDFWKPDLYDVCIDTYGASREQTLQRVLDVLK